MTRIKDLANQDYSFAADDVQDKDGPTQNSRKITPFDAHGQFRNALAPRAGIYFSGVASTGAAALLSASGTHTQSIGTGDFTIAAVFKVPASNPTAAMGICYLGSTKTTYFAAGGCSVNIDTSGNLNFNVTDGTNTKSRQVAGFVGLYGGKRVSLVVTRTGTTVALYANAIALTAADVGSTPSYGQSITSTYLGIGFDTASTPFKGEIHSITLYNLVLPASAIMEVFEIGGTVPSAYKWGDIAASTTGAVCHFPLDDGLTYHLEDVSPNGLHAVMTATGCSHILTRGGPKRIRGTTNTLGNQMLLGANLIPQGCMITRWWAKLVSGSTEIVSMGTASGAVNLINANSVNTVIWNAAGANGGSGPIQATSDFPIWINGASAAVVIVVLEVHEMQI